MGSENVWGMGRQRQESKWRKGEGANLKETGLSVVARGLLRGHFGLPWKWGQKATGLALGCLCHPLDSGLWESDHPAPSSLAGGV